jgi:hypothetical protein
MFPFSQSACKVFGTEASDVRWNGTLPLTLCVGCSSAMPRLTQMLRIFSSRVNLIALVIRFYTVSRSILIESKYLTISICKTRVGSSETLSTLMRLHESSNSNRRSTPADLASPSNILTASLAIESSWTSTGVMTNNPESSFDMVSTSSTIVFICFEHCTIVSAASTVVSRMFWYAF